MSYIHYITPFRSDKNIGRAYNEACATCPDTGFICIRDPDTMFLLPDSQSIVEHLAYMTTHYDLIGCTTNRLRGGHQAVKGMFDIKELDAHIAIAKASWDIWKLAIMPTQQPVAGMFMLFRKSLWDRIKFNETTGMHTDKQFSADVLKSGGKLGVAQGLYLFHLYRWGSTHPYDDIEHLMTK